MVLCSLPPYQYSLLPPHLPSLYCHIYICWYSFEFSPHLPCSLLASPLAPLPSAGVPSFFCLVLRFSVPSSVWENESFHLQPSFLGLGPCPTANLLMDLQPGCTYSPHPCVAHTRFMEILHSNAHDFFPLKPGQLLSVHHYRQILGAKEKRKKRQWKTMTRAPSQSV